MREVFYHSKEERKELLKEANQLGEYSIHDDFLDENDNHTDGTIGRLTFIKDLEPHPIDEGALFTKLYLDFSLLCDAIKFLDLLFPKMYESYDEKKLNEITDKLGLDKEKTSWKKVLIEYAKKSSEKYLENSKRLGTNSFSITPDEIDKFIMSMSMTQMTLPKIPDFLREMSIVYLVTIFQEFLRNILKTVYTTQLLKGKGVDNKQEKKIKKWIEFDIEKSRINLANKYQIDITKSYWHEITLTDKTWNRFTEYFYRRNSVIHANSFADDEYRKKTNTNIHEKLVVDQKYLQDAIKDFKTYAKNITIAFREKYVSK